MKGKRNFIASAIKHPGALRRKAKRAGKSTAAFAREHAGDSGTTGKQARLAETLGRLRKKKGRGKSSRPHYGRRR
jgi:hypothetical protein